MAENQKIFMLYITEHLLQTFSSNAVTVDNSPRTFAATDIGTGTFAAGEVISVSGAAESANNSTFTLVTVAADLLTVTETTTTEVAGASVVINEYLYGTWKETRDFRYLTGTINASQPCTLYIDQSRDGVNTDHTDTIVVGAGVAESWNFANVVSGFARVRILNGGTDQTSMRCILYGRVN